MALLAVKVDRGSEQAQVVSGGRQSRAAFRKLPTEIAVKVRQQLILEEFQQAIDTLERFLWSSMPRND
jgi:hypothetical protein